METITYLIKSASILSLFYMVYYVVLRKDTFFRANRHYLILGIIAALFLPMLEFTRIIYVATPAGSELMVFEGTMIPSSQIEQQLAFNWWSLIGFLYLGGVLFMGIRFLKQILSLFSIFKKYPASKKNGYVYIQVDKEVTPFSFFKYIVYNPSMHDRDELEMILKHEQVHASQLHSLDILLANIVLVLQWINPFAWLYTKSIEENLEYIADNETAQNVASKKEYQLALVKASSHFARPALTNNFYQSFIKKRIVMLNKSTSKTKNVWKLSFILPILALFLWSFNVKEEIVYTETEHGNTEHEITPKITDNSLNVIENEPEKEAVVVDIKLPVGHDKPEVATSKGVSEINISPAVVTTKETTSNSFFQKASTTTWSVQGSSTSLEETPSSSNTNEVYTDGKISLTIDKNSTDADLDKMKKLFKDLYDVTFKYSGVKRNSDGAITDIKVNMKSKTSSASFNESEDDGIDPILITYNSESGSISLGNTGNHTMVWTSDDDHDNTFVIDTKVHTGTNATVWTHDKDGNRSKKIIKGGRTIIIDDEGDNKKIEKVHISSGGSKNIFIHSDDDDDHENSSVIIRSDNDDDGGGFFFVDRDGDTDPLIIIDGKESTIDLKDLDSKNILSIEVIKGKAAEKKYGKKGKDGVIEITTKKN